MIVRTLARLVALAATAAAAAGCATNPVTGRPQFVLMSETQEIAIGREAAPQIAASMGLYDDEALQRYVEEIGLRMAKDSERPELPWQFRVVDDALVNAFAVPGGFIYLTRGILAHMNSEAELASVLGHEIGHVTARHSVAQQTKQMGAQLVLLPAMVLVPELQAVGQLLGAGLQVLFLKYGRDDERQSDELGLDYMTRAGYRPEEMVDVFRTLDRIGEGSRSEIPEWMSTHPSPANRVQTISERIAQLGLGGGTGRVGRETFLERLDGVVYGQDPREGWFDDDGVFHHPGLAFRLRVPKDWKTVNQKTMVGALSPERDAIVQLTLAKEETPSDAARAFLAGQGIQSTTPQSTKVSGLAAVTADFAAAGQQGSVRGVAAFVQHREQVFRLIGFSQSARFPAREQALRGAVNSFARETDSAVLSVSPWRIDIVTPSRALTSDAFARTYPGPLSAKELALINQIPEGGSYEAGVPAKRVVGKPLP